MIKLAELKGAINTYETQGYEFADTDILCKAAQFAVEVMEMKKRECDCGDGANCHMYKDNRAHNALIDQLHTAFERRMR